MEFDKRTIAAFILIGLILFFVNTEFYQKMVFGDRPAMPPHELARQDTVSVAPEKARKYADRLSSLPAAGNVSDSTLSADERSLEREIRIETPLFAATLSSLGGNLKHWQTKEYKDAAGKPVVLVSEGAGNLSFVLPFEGDSLDTGLLDFTVNVDSFKIGPGMQRDLVFERELAPGKVIRKSYKISGDLYTMGLKVELINLKEQLTGYDYSILWRSGPESSEKNIKDEMSDTKAYTYVSAEVVDLDVGDKLHAEKSEQDRDISWAAIRTKYFAFALVPRSEPGRGIQLTGHTSPSPQDPSVRLKHYELALRMPLARTETTTHDFDVYLGPLEHGKIKALGANVEEIMNWGWGPVKPFSKIVLWALVSLHKFIPNYGWVIVIFSVLVKIILHPLTKKSYESMKQMQVLQPKMMELREKYASDPQKMNSELMKMYQEYGVNPLGGCLPMLLQMPLLYALFIVFRSTIEFRQAPFLGWITDLSAPDTIFYLPFNVPMYGNFVTVLPLVMGITMFIQQKISITDPKQKMMVYIMPVIFTLLFNSFPSGLNLYYTLFNIFSIAQQMLIAKAPVKPVVKKKKSNKFSLAQLRRLGPQAALSRKRLMK